MMILDFFKNDLAITCFATCLSTVKQPYSMYPVMTVMHPFVYSFVLSVSFMSMYQVNTIVYISHIKCLTEVINSSALPVHSFTHRSPIHSNAPSHPPFHPSIHLCIHPSSHLLTHTCTQSNNYVIQTVHMLCHIKNIII